MSNDPNRPQQLPYGQPGPQYGRYGQQPPAHPAPPYGQPPYGQQYGVPSVPNFVPQQAKKPRRALRRLLLIGAVFVVLVGGAIVAAVVITNHNSAMAIATQYYDAVKSQDYASAFTYLDPQGITVGGHSLTQSRYIQAARTIDAQKGVVSSYSIASTAINSTNGVNTAAFTVSVTRREQSYAVHLQLRQEDSGWKIVSIDNI